MKMQEDHPPDHQEDPQEDSRDLTNQEEKTPTSETYAASSEG